jgi:NADH:flavin oxidoreductases, Old Yellow Enzyme family
MYLSHRMVMAPMTRFRADGAHVPLPMVKEYYEQRADVPSTLIITEANSISPQAGFTNVPGIYNQAQIAAWRQVTDTVHARGSYIYLQLWALGCAADAEVLNAQCYGLVSNSPSPLGGDSPILRELADAEIRQYISDGGHDSKGEVFSALSRHYT